MYIEWTLLPTDLTDIFLSLRMWDVMFFYCEVVQQSVNFWQLEYWSRPAPPILFCLDDDAKVTTWEIQGILHNPDIWGLENQVFLLWIIQNILSAPDMRAICHYLVRLTACQTKAMDMQIVVEFLLISYRSRHQGCMLNWCQSNQPIYKLVDHKQSKKRLGMNPEDLAAI